MTPSGPGRRRRRDALAVIAKEPAAGLAKTRLVPALGEAGAARAAAAMLADTLAAVRTAGAEPWLCFTPAEAGERLARTAPGFGLLAQEGGDLGDRLAACLARLLAAGADRVAIVGADTPHVPATIYRRAFALLGPADVVLGPALDGGYYLVAAKAARPELFVGVPMGTEAVLSETLARAARAGLAVALLPRCATSTGSRTWPPPWPAASWPAPRPPWPPRPSCSPTMGSRPGERGARGRRPDRRESRHGVRSQAGEHDGRGVRSTRCAIGSLAGPACGSRS